MMLADVGSETLTCEQATAFLQRGLLSDFCIVPVGRTWNLCFVLDQGDVSDRLRLLRAHRITRHNEGVAAFRTLEAALNVASQIGFKVTIVGAWKPSKDQRVKALEEKIQFLENMMITHQRSSC
jgi:hypothetical protein